MKVQTLCFSWAWTRSQDPQEITAPPPFSPQPFQRCRGAGGGKWGVPKQAVEMERGHCAASSPCSVLQSLVVGLNAALGLRLAILSR